MCVCIFEKTQTAHGTVHAVCFGSVRQTITVASKVRWSGQKAQIYLCVWIRYAGLMNDLSGKLMCTSLVPSGFCGIVKRHFLRPLCVSEG